MDKIGKRKRPLGTLIRRLPWNGKTDGVEALLHREWIVTNGLGGYASCTVSGVCTRKYHGILIAAMPAPQGRLVMLNGLSEELRFPDGSTAGLKGEEPSEGQLNTPGIQCLKEFRLEMGLPVWTYEIGGYVIERRILLPHMQNTVYINYRLLFGKGPVRLKLHPSMRFRPQHEEVGKGFDKPYVVHAIGDHYEIMGERHFPNLRFFLYGQDGSFNLSGGEYRDAFYRVEQKRCYECRGLLWSPGFFRVLLNEKKDATLVASTESWDVIHALKPREAFAAEMDRRQRLLVAADPKARRGPAAELVLTADQFLIAPISRVGDVARARATGGEVRSVIAGYHWFTDWGRDTMISLEGLTLATGRLTEAVYILRTFAHYVRDGLIPNMFPEGKTEGLYHTADATLWFFHAINRYLEATEDYITLGQLLPRLMDIVNHHIRGTRFGIGIDPVDGLLRQGAEGYQLTWMDAKFGDWVVTPRRGKAVEINALWYNALRLLEEWLRSERSENEARPISDLADQVYASFNSRFWYEEGGYLLDVVDDDHGDDTSFRPNQLFAVSLSHPVLEPSRWKPVIEAVRERLLTPFGLRSLAPGHPDYKPTYEGDLCQRDSAYHQGTVWSWLIGPFIDAWLKVYPEDRAGARHFLKGLISHLDDACIGSISEVFGADAPFGPEGCVSQAWSVAELLRCWIKTSEE